MSAYILDYPRVLELADAMLYYQIINDPEWDWLTGHRHYMIPRSVYTNMCDSRRPSIRESTYKRYALPGEFLWWE